MKPLAIILDQTHVRERSWRVALPDGSKKWKFAKMCVRTADWVSHELGSHLSRTHFVMEVAALATYRSLAKDHPIYQLLAPHFYKTLSLNAAARTILVPEIIATRLTPFSSEQCWALCSEYFGSFDFSNYPLRDLAARGVGALPPEVYPYACTARAVWHALRAYVYPVIQGATSAVGGPLVSADICVSNWASTLHRNMPGFPSPDRLQNVDELVDAVTMIIFVSSHSHAAANYFQSKYQGYTPAGEGRRLL